MSASAILAMLLGSLCFHPSMACAIGGDHTKQELAKHGANCVHGYFVNDTDVFFFAGEAAEFNQAAAALAKKKGVKLRIIVHAGAKKARSPWDKADRDIPVDWSVTTYGPITREVLKQEAETIKIDVWLGGKIKKDEVKYPPGTEVISGTEVEKIKS